MMISKNQESILIITHDLKLNRIFTTRYFSFIRALKAQNYLAKGAGIDFAFKPHPINNLDKINENLDIDLDIITINPKNLNVIQRLLAFSDKYNLPFRFKKYLLALHIMVYNTDQWMANPDDFKSLKEYKPTIVIAGGAGGIIETAYRLSKKYNAKLILDYRDPWNFGYNLLETNKFVSQFKRKFTVQRELELLKSADHIITVSESLKSFFPPEFQHKITVIENGSNFEQEEIITKINCKPSQFNVVYLGTVYDDQLFEEDFFIAFAEFYKNSTVKEQISLKFIGSDKNLKLKKILKKYGLDEISEITVRVDNETLIQYLLNASIFLHLRFKGRSKIISSKISDYLMFRKPILLPVSDKGDIADSITHYNAGYVCNGVGETLESLREEYKKYLTGESIVLHKNDFSWLSRKELAKKLTKIISSLNSPNPPSL